MKLDLVLHFNSNTTGMGIHGYNLLKALMKAGKKIAFIPIQDLQYQLIDSCVNEALGNRQYITGREVGLMIYHASHMLKFCGSKRYGFAIHETDRIPDIERMYYNTLDEVLTPSHWSKQILVENGITKPIRVVPEGYDEELYNVQHTPEYVIERAKQRGYWTFLHIGKFEARKSSAMIIQAFQTACCQARVHANLIMKCENPFNPEWRREFDEAVRMQGNEYGTVLLQKSGDLKDEDMAGMYQDCDFGLYASRGEAWGLPIMEGIASGLPTITTACTGQSEYLKDYPKILIVPCGEKEIADDGVFFRGDRGQWIVPSYDQIVLALKYVLLNPEFVYKSLRPHCVNAVREYTWQNAVKKII